MLLFGDYPPCEVRNVHKMHLKMMEVGIKCRKECAVGPLKSDFLRYFFQKC